MITWIPGEMFCLRMTSQFLNGSRPPRHLCPNHIPLAIFHPMLSRIVSSLFSLKSHCMHRSNNNWHQWQPAVDMDGDSDWEWSHFKLLIFYVAGMPCVLLKIRTAKNKFVSPCNSDRRVWKWLSCNKLEEWMRHAMINDAASLPCRKIVKVDFCC